MEVGDHSWSHMYLTHASRATITAEIQRGQHAIVNALGLEPRWYRPAGGLTNAFVRSEAKRLGLRLVQWTVDPRDWSRPGTRTIARRVLDNVRPGSVILMHDGGGDRSQTVAALALVLKGLKARGYAMVTLSALYGLPDPVPVAKP
jgi:peptidoglycan/xylan/chitin deacetylase (PgdA/CDA1 family)